jgi:hypothetical protein
VSIDKAANILSFHPHDDVKSIVGDLIANRSEFEDWDNPAYYNIDTLRILDAGLSSRTPQVPEDSGRIRRQNAKASK